MADLTEVQASMSVKVAGAGPSSGIEDNYLDVDSTGRLTIKLNDSAGSAITNGQQTMANSVPVVFASDQTSLKISNFPTTVDTNYGTAGASTIRTASQIGNATGAALFGAGTTTAQVLRVVLPTDQTAIPVSQSGTWSTGRTWTLASGTDSVAAVQSGTWTVQPGNTPNSTPWLVTDSADGPVTPGAVAGKSMLIGGQFNTALPTLTNTQQSAFQLDSSGRLIIRPLASGTDSVSAVQSGTWNIGTVTSITNTVAVTQSTSPWVVSGTITAAEDKNYGTVGATTLRTASQIGNATGAADFAAGNSSAQTLRVVVATNQAALPVSQSGAWTVSATQGTSPWIVQDNASNTSAAAAATRGLQVMGIFNTTPTTLTNGQSGFLQLDSAENLLVNLKTAIPTGANTIGAVTQASGPWTQNLTQVAGSAISLGQKTMANSFPVVLASDQSAIPVSQSGTWTVQPGNTANTTPWLVTDSSDGTVAAGTAAAKSSLAGLVFNTALPTLTNGQQAAMQGDSSGRLIIAPLTSTSVITANQGTANTHGNAWFTRLTDGTDDSLISPNGDVQVMDIVNVSGQFRAQSVTTSAAEALGAASILTNRKSLTVTPTNGTVYWGYANTVTTSNGSPIFKNQTVSWAIGASVHVYLIAGSTIDCRITEGS